MSFRKEGWMSMIVGVMLACARVVTGRRIGSRARVGVVKGEWVVCLAVGQTMVSLKGGLGTVKTASEFLAGGLMMTSRRTRLKGVVSGDDGPGGEGSWRCMIQTHGSVSRRRMWTRVGVWRVCGRRVAVASAIRGVVVSRTCVSSTRAEGVRLV